jgi:hypothetical protein
MQSSLVDPGKIEAICELLPLLASPTSELYLYKRKRRAKDDKKTRIKIKDRGRARRSPLPTRLTQRPGKTAQDARRKASHPKTLGLSKSP